jgi:hypothetical protein
VGKALDDRRVELAPHELVEPLRDSPRGVGIIGRRLARLEEAGADRDRAEAQIRREAGGRVRGGEVAALRVMRGVAREKAAESPPCRLFAGGRQRTAIVPHAERRRRRDRARREPRRRRWQTPRRRGLRRVLLEALPPRAPVRRVHRERSTLARADGVSREDDAVRPLDHAHAGRFERCAHPRVAAPRVGRRVRVPGDEVGAQLARERRDQRAWIASTHEQPAAARLEPARERRDRLAEKAHSRLAPALRVEERVVEDEDRREYVGCAGVRERPVVREAQIVAKPVDGARNRPGITASC